MPNARNVLIETLVFGGKTFSVFHVLHFIKEISNVVSVSDVLGQLFYEKFVIEQNLSVVKLIFILLCYKTVTVESSSDFGPKKLLAAGDMQQLYSYYSVTTALLTAVLVLVNADCFG